MNKVELWLEIFKTVYCGTRSIEESLARTDAAMKSAPVNTLAQEAPEGAQEEAHLARRKERRS